MEDSGSLQPPLLRVKLGRTDIEISRLGIGAWAWGDRFYWGYGRGYQEDDILSAFQTSVNAGVNFFDTAEVYGQGQSERLLSQCVKTIAQPVIVATKFFPYPWRLSRSSLTGALHGSLKRLEIKSADLYQIHFPIPILTIESWASALADAVQAGLTRAVGVSNYNEEQMRRADLVLEKRGIPLASNQVDYSLLNRKIEKNRMLKTCRELNITLIAYSPLAQGVLSGKYTPDKPPSGVRGRRYNRAYLAKIQPLIQLLREIGRAHGGKTPSQVALNWVICKGAVPIPGAKNQRQAQDNCGALGWQLTGDEVAALDAASDQIGSP
jgi:aryl-alcohol dehydrogenase-like predicted oxidoreductase